MQDTRAVTSFKVVLIGHIVTQDKTIKSRFASQMLAYNQQQQQQQYNIQDIRAISQQKKTFADYCIIADRTTLIVHTLLNFMNVPTFCPSSQKTTTFFLSIYRCIFFHTHFLHFFVIVL